MCTYEWGIRILSSAGDVSACHSQGMLVWRLLHVLFFRKVLEKVLEKNQTASGAGALSFMQTTLPVTASFARPDDPEAVSYGRCSSFHGPTHTHTLGCTCPRQAKYVGAFASTFTSAEALRQKYSTHHRLFYRAYPLLCWEGYPPAAFARAKFLLRRRRIHISSLLSTTLILG